ncbi:MAG: adenylosuccinate lyase, partial [Chlamydiia bacterium]|nr:adenylosuccinate lyase [Chlamydiia bacterium]
NSADNASLQWLERSLDDSSNRRLTIPEAFLATDSILNLLYSITDGLKIYPKLMETHLLEHLPYISTEILLAAAALQGKDRQKTHEQLRVLTFEATKQKKETGKAPDLLKTLLDALGFSEKALSDELKPEKLTGRAKQQVIAFLKLEVEPILEKHLTLETTIPTIEF